MELKMNTALVQTELALDAPNAETETYEGVCVLVVEDDDADAYLIERALSANPNVSGIIRATDGVEALHLVDIGAVDPDVALIDLHMPRKNGFHLLADFAERRSPCFPMVVLTSSTAPTDAMRSRLRGATRVLTKPDSIADLEEVLSAAITSACTGITLPGRGGRAAKRRTAFDNSPPRPKGQKIQPLN
jgi:CheY-like chemotaxis protein